jgi:hypothetical protein
LNACLVFYAQALKKVDSSDVQTGSHDLMEVAMSEYQPNTLEKIHKHSMQAMQAMQPMQPMPMVPQPYEYYTDTDSSDSD